MEPTLHIHCTTTPKLATSNPQIRQSRLLRALNRLNKLYPRPRKNLHTRRRQLLKQHGLENRHPGILGAFAEDGTAAVSAELALHIVPCISIIHTHRVYRSL